MINSAKIRLFTVFLFIILQIIFIRFFPHIPFIPDMLFLIIAYTAMKASFLKAYFASCLLGWLTDFLCGGITGVFGFSRIVAAAMLHETVKYIDLKKKGFTFFLVFVSLLISNGIASAFFYLINHNSLSLSLVLWQPLSTAALALVLVYTKSISVIWDVY